MPLAHELRPKTLEEFVGQEKIVSKNSFITKAILGDDVPSLLFWGPPGSGKTTLALIIAKMTKANFIQLSATDSGVKDLKKVIETARGARLTKTILFIDEIHRWNKAQQDALLPHVEKGEIILIGATTENPSFAVNSALLSRLKTVVLEALNKKNLVEIINRAISKLQDRGKTIVVTKDIIDLIANLSNGDARVALNILENCLKHSSEITEQLVKDIINKPNLLNDKDGEEHYNLISALHKSMRGNNPDAAVYYLARMLEAGADPLYVARRLVRFASEDIGLINNSALMIASSAYDAVKNIGLPECKVHLTQTVIYLANSPKDITAYMAYEAAAKEVFKSGNLAIPFHLRNAPTKFMKDLGYSKGYKYTPMEDDSNQEYLPSELKGKKFVKRINKNKQ
ncbi:MAG: replication-associated recombination protein A [Planctomycetes bacterium]|jgi:putative ATPase|nr:replication-associated recombination protein A [Planctomycetota bacterium]